LGPRTSALCFAQSSFLIKLFVSAKQKHDPGPV
jgi:hypothetical protein